MNKHTQGPWYAVGMWVEFEDDDKPDICTCNPKDFEQGHLHRSAEEIYANARLIAAAPDLLEALKLADATLAGANMNLSVVQNKIQTAIAKATGEQA